jgi:hypothetical protein
MTVPAEADIDKSACCRWNEAYSGRQLQLYL